MFASDVVIYTSFSKVQASKVFVNYLFLELYKYIISNSCFKLKKSVNKLDYCLFINNDNQRHEMFTVFKHS